MKAEADCLWDYFCVQDCCELLDIAHFLDGGLLFVIWIDFMIFFLLLGFDIEEMQVYLY